MTKVASGVDKRGETTKIKVEDRKRSEPDSKRSEKDKHGEKRSKDN